MDKTSVTSTAGGLPPTPGLTWELVCIAVVFLSALALAGVALVAIVNNQNPSLGLMLTTIFLLVLTLTLTPRLANKYRKRQRLSLLSAEALMEHDPRPPVLYLRSFTDDEKIGLAIAFYSVEQEMKVVLSEIGPFVTLAQPDNHGPLDPGASRLRRMPQDSWREEVSEAMSNAALVLIRIGLSVSLRWEMCEAVRRVRPERLIFLLSSEREELYEIFRRDANNWLPSPLPEFKRTKRWPGIQGAIIYFEPDWTPHLQAFKVEWTRQTFWNGFSVVFKIAMRPVYEQLGYGWTMPPVQPTQLLYISLLFLLPVFAGYLCWAMVRSLLALFS